MGGQRDDSDLDGHNHQGLNKRGKTRSKAKYPAIYAGIDKDHEWGAWNRPFKDRCDDPTASMSTSPRQDA